MQPDPASLDPEERLNKFYALFSAALGILSLCAALVPICGGGLAVAGLILGWLGIKSESEKIAIAGLIFSGIGLLISIVYAVFLAFRVTS